jgi:hypothetical protein
MTEQELRDLIKSQLGDIIKEGKGPKLEVEVPMRAPELKRFTHNYLRLNKKYSILRAPEYSMMFGENKWKKETHWKYDTADQILYVHDEKVVDILLKGGAPSDLFESNTLNENKGRDLADKYVAILRKEFRKLNDDELEEFNKTIAYAFGYTVEGKLTEAASNFKVLLRTAMEEPIGRKIRLGGKRDPFQETWERITKTTWMNLETKKKLNLDKFARHMDEFHMDGNDLQFESKLNEMDMNDPFMIQVRVMRHAARERKALMQYLKDNPKPKVRKISFDKYLDLLDTQSGLLDDLKDLTKQLQQADSDMNNEAGQKGDKWTDDDANRYGDILMDLEEEYEKVKAKLTKVEVKIEKYNLQ